MEFSMEFHETEKWEIPWNSWNFMKFGFDRVDSTVDARLKAVVVALPFVFHFCVILPSALSPFTSILLLFFLRI
jgi:hypothetical protein